MRGPLVSIIMPSIRDIDTVSKAIIGISKQTYEALELVLLRINGNPIDERGHRRLVVPENLSLGELRNIACREARGSIIVVWDDDDWFEVTRLERIVAALETHDVCGSSLVRLEDAKKKKAYEWDGEELQKEDTARLYGATLAFRRNVWEANNFNPHMHIGEDIEWMQRVHGVTKWLDFRDPTMSKHSINDTNTSPKRPGPPCWREVPYE